MEKSTLHSSNDYNLMPHRRLQSNRDIEFKKLCASLEKKQISSLIKGPDYRELKDKQLDARFDEFLKRSKPGISRRKFYPNQKEIFSRALKLTDYITKADDNLKWFDSCIAYLKGEHLNKVFSDEEDRDRKKESALNWDIDKLISNPLEAFSSWCEAYEKFKDLMEADNPFPIDINEWFSFLATSIYLLCLFIPGKYNENYNPLEMAKTLMDSLETTYVAFSDLSLLYPQLSRIETTSQEIMYMSMELDNRYRIPMLGKWFVEDNSELAKALYIIYKRNIYSNDLKCSDRTIGYLAKELARLFSSDVRLTYYLPFICTKIFAQIFYDSEWKTRESKEKDDRETEKQFKIYLEEIECSFETYKRLFDSHQKKAGNDYLFDLNSNDHPLIRFMQDICTLAYQIGLFHHEMKEISVMDQINTNWLTLYMFGRRRYFDNPCICSEFCDLTLPILMNHLFKQDEEDDPGFLWVVAILNQPYNEPTDPEWFDGLDDSVEFKWVLFDIEDDEWRKVLVHSLFDPHMWCGTCLNEELLIKYPRQVTNINSAISKIFMKLKADYDEEEDTLIEMASIVVRTKCTLSILFPMLEQLLGDFKSYLDAPERQAALFRNYVMKQRYRIELESGESLSPIRLFSE